MHALVCLDFSISAPLPLKYLCMPQIQCIQLQNPLMTPPLPTSSSTDRRNITLYHHDETPTTGDWSNWCQLLAVCDEILVLVRQAIHHLHTNFHHKSSDLGLRGWRIRLEVFAGCR